MGEVVDVIDMDIDTDSIKLPIDTLRTPIAARRRYDLFMGYRNSEAYRNKELKEKRDGFARYLSLAPAIAVALDKLSQDLFGSVVKLIAEAFTNRQIAETLKLSEKTIESHRANVFAKLGMRDREEIVRYAIRRGLVEA